MKIGLLARADDRGIGHMCWEFARHMPVAKTLIVREPGAESSGFVPHMDRYPEGSAVCWFDGGLPEDAMAAFLDDLDVVYIVETPYDMRLLQMAESRRVATVIHVMPEFWRWDDPEVPRPTRWWIPTTWRQEHLPTECVLVPVPVPEPSRPIIPPDPDRPLSVVHVAGHPAARDRNGTQIMMRAALRLRNVRLRFHSQGALAATDRIKVPVERVRSVVDRWEMVDDASVLVLPRRYGGLCLPALEALAAGVVPVMPDVSPNRDWPIVPVPAAYAGAVLQTQAGRIPLAAVDPRRLAMSVQSLTDPDRLEDARDAVRIFAKENDWSTLAPLYLAELERAVDAC